MYLIELDPVGNTIERVDLAATRVARQVGDGVHFEVDDTRQESSSAEVARGVCVFFVFWLLGLRLGNAPSALDNQHERSSHCVSDVFAWPPGCLEDNCSPFELQYF